MEPRNLHSRTNAEAYLLGLIDDAARAVGDRGLAERNIRLAISLFHARRLISAQQQQALLLRMMRRHAGTDAAECFVDTRAKIGADGR